MGLLCFKFKCYFWIFHEKLLNKFQCAFFSCWPIGSLRLLKRTFLSKINSFGNITFQSSGMQKCIGHFHKLYLSQNDQFFCGKHFFYHAKNMSKISSKSTVEHDFHSFFFFLTYSGLNSSLGLIVFNLKWTIGLKNTQIIFLTFDTKIFRRIRNFWKKS